MSPIVNYDHESGIPVVDFGPFRDGTRKQEVADAILKSFKEVGFVYLVNHGIPQEKMDGIIGWAKKFFALPMEIKMLAPHPPLGTHHRGYSPPGLEKIIQHEYDPDKIVQSRKKAPDAKENFESGKENDKVIPNIWLPDGILPGFKEACLDYFWTCYDVELNVFRALALGFRINEEYFTEYHSAADNQLRILHYFSVPVKDVEEGLAPRIGAHSDFGSITMLLQDQAGGLEVEDPHSPGEFKAATPIPGSLVINAGDLLMRWSNDTIRSTVHRVRAPKHMYGTDCMTPERYSVPYFCGPNHSTIIDSIPGTWSETVPKKYEPIDSTEYLMKRLAMSYT
ncbi:Clavaminate synthase-like protein [Desarmillaria tabescens]|uniref:Clavaminate synthase-like protein n=1 Tax=Armillaria tabescens TaxID=1929756 RepID=A0AA39NA19_ARMTA|nr:Clavaminate synthase-like protein [Desarmillaria tabescens]KAK0461812.1 Clavaminate synthase-like protein [Desarmillaria tabescens]